jgi:hypothetical protein
LYTQEKIENELLKNLITILVKNFHQTSVGLIIFEVKKLIKSKNESMVCNILNDSIEIQEFTTEYFKLLVDEGIIDYLLSLFELKSNELNTMILCIISKSMPNFVHFEMVDVINLFLKEFSEFFKKNPSNQKIYLMMFGIYNLSPQKENLVSKKLEVDSKLINVEDLLEFILKYPNPTFHMFANMLIGFQKDFKSDILKRVIDEVLDSINLNPNINCYFYVKWIVEKLKYDFKPWLGKTMKICANRLEDLLLEDDLELSESIDFDVFHLLNTLIDNFGEECELYISKYKIIEVLDKCMFLDPDVKLFDLFYKDFIKQKKCEFSISTLLLLGYYKSKSLELYIPSFIKNYNQLIEFVNYTDYFL